MSCSNEQSDQEAGRLHHHSNKCFYFGTSSPTVVWKGCKECSTAVVTTITTKSYFWDAVIVETTETCCDAADGDGLTVDTKTKNWGWFKERTVVIKGIKAPTSATDVVTKLTVVVPTASGNGKTAPTKVAINVSNGTGTKEGGWFTEKKKLIFGIVGFGMIVGGLVVTFAGAAAGATGVGTVVSIAGLSITVGGILLLNYCADEDNFNLQESLTEV